MSVDEQRGSFDKNPKHSVVRIRSSTGCFLNCANLGVNLIRRSTTNIFWVTATKSRALANAIASKNPSGRLRETMLAKTGCILKLRYGLRADPHWAGNRAVELRQWDRWRTALIQVGHG